MSQSPVKLPPEIRFDPIECPPETIEAANVAQKRTGNRRFEPVDVALESMENLRRVLRNRLDS